MQLKRDITKLEQNNIDTCYYKYIPKIIELLTHEKYNKHLQSMSLKNLCSAHLHQKHYHQDGQNNQYIYNAIYINKNLQQGYYNWNLQSIYLLLKSYIINNLLPIAKTISTETTLQALIDDLSTIKQVFLYNSDIHAQYNGIIEIINNQNIQKNLTLKQLDSKSQYINHIIKHWQSRQHYLCTEDIKQMLINYNKMNLQNNQQ